MKTRNIFNSKVKYISNPKLGNNTPKFMKAKIVRLDFNTETVHVIVGLHGDTDFRIETNFSQVLFYGKDLKSYIRKLDKDLVESGIIFNYRNPYGFEVGQILTSTLGSYKGRIKITGITSNEVYLVPIDKTKGSESIFRSFEFRSNRHKNLSENNKNITL